MDDLWATLIPLAVAGALVPAQIVVTVLLLRAPGGALAAAAFVAGMTVVRLGQGVVFGLVLTGADASGETSGPGTIAAVLLLVLGLLFYATAARTALADVDPDAPPPKWLAMTDTMTWPKALAFGAMFMLVAPKFWVFTLSAIAAIEEAELGTAAASMAFLGFVALTQSVLIAIVLFGALAPARSATALDAVSGWLERNDRILVIAIGAIFGTWFAVKGLSGLGVL